MVLLSANAKAQQYTEYDLKAAYIYNFSKFVSWPTESIEPKSEKFQIVIFGNSPISPTLYQALKGRRIQGKEISIRVVYLIENIGNPHIIFVAKKMKLQTNELVSYCENKPILLIGDVIDGFCQMGGIINFTKKSSKYRFEINNKQSQNSKLKISSKLLALARIIRSEEIKF